jgi:hypothetical protein
LAAWATPEFRVHLPASLAQETWSHSAYLDLLLGAGVLAVIPFAMAVGAGFWRAGLVALDRPSLGSAWPIALGTLVLVAATQESFIVGSHFLWLLCVGALAAASGSHSPSAQLGPVETPASRSQPR